MHSRRSHLTYALGTLVMGAALVLVGPVNADDSTTIDPSTQPHLKSWSNIIPNAVKRFVVLADFSNLAVLDRETGLVWEKTPNPNPAADWVQASANCVNKSIANRKGWRLPSVVELASLIDTSQSFPTLPTGHPFTNVQADNYWTSTTYEPDRNIAWGVNFNGGSVSVILFKNGTGLWAWCVRGPMNADAY